MFRNDVKLSDISFACVCVIHFLIERFTICVIAVIPLLGAQR